MACKHVDQSYNRHKYPVGCTAGVSSMCIFRHVCAWTLGSAATSALSHCDSMPAVAHEIGHNFGFDHANNKDNTVEYGDITSGKTCMLA